MVPFQFSSPLLLSLSMSGNHVVSLERSMHLQFLFFKSYGWKNTHVFVHPYLVKTLHCHFTQRYPPSYPWAETYGVGKGPPNLKSSVIGCVRKYELSKNGVIKNFFKK